MNLNPIEKLLFLYFLTNPYTDICGVYEVPLKHIELETGIKPKDIVKVLIKFEKDDKIFYQNGWVAVKNFTKHQKNNPKVQIGIEEGLEKAPQTLVDRLKHKKIGYQSLSNVTEFKKTESKGFSDEDTEWDANPKSPTYGMRVKIKK